MSDTTSTSSIERSNAERKQIRKERLVLLRKNKAFVVGSAILVFWIVLAIFGKLIAPYAADEMSFEFTGTGPSRQFWFGTDGLGQDVLSRVIIGTRSSGRRKSDPHHRARLCCRCNPASAGR